jgi:hypothetical protein
MKTATQSHDEFVSKLNKMLADIKQAAESQYKYNLKENIPSGIGGITLDNAAEHAIESGTVNAIGKFIEWEPDSAILWAHHILEDNNVHDVAKEFWDKYLA